MSVSGIRIGHALLKIRVAHEIEGVQVDFEHLEGGEAHFFARIPVPPDHEVRVEYIDWMRQDEAGIAHEIRIGPGSEPRTLFGRFRPRPPTWPTFFPESTPEGLTRDGILIELAGDDPLRTRMLAFAAGLEKMLEVPVHVLARRAPAPSPGFASASPTTPCARSRCAASSRPPSGSRSRGTRGSLRACSPTTAHVCSKS